MQDIKYHPLIDCDSKGTEKVPMFFSGDESTVRKAHDFYLEEIVPGNYRLCSVKGTAAKIANTFTLHCPYCGKAMKQFANPLNRNRLGLYNCLDCTKK